MVAILQVIENERRVQNIGVLILLNKLMPIGGNPKRLTKYEMRQEVMGMRL